MTKERKSKDSGKNDHVRGDHGNIPDKHFDQYTLFQKLVDNLPDHIYIKDRKNRFVMVNSTFADFYGKKPEDFVGKTDFDFFSKEHAKQTYEDEQQIMAAGKPIVDIEEKKTFRDKKDRWVLTTKMPFYNEKGKLIGTFGISRDITERKLIEHKLEREMSFMNALMEKIPDSIYFKDRNSRFVRINKALAEKFGLKDPGDAVGKTDSDFFSKKLSKIRYDGEQQIIKTGRPILNEEKIEIIKNKEERWTSATKLPWYDQDNNIIGTFGITRDITEKKKAEEKIKYLSFHDSLTGLYNRTYFDEELRRLDTERQLPITIVMGDVNGLKAINDAYGHEKGDQFLKKIADILRDTFRKEDVVSRWGGDEFIVILPGTYEKDTKDIINRIKKMCIERSAADMPLSISLGVASKKSPEEDIDSVIKEAEDKMYKYKLSESKSTNEIIVSSLRENLKRISKRSKR